MAGFTTSVSSAGGMVAGAILILATAGHALASNEKPPVQNISYNGFTCDHVRAKVAESGVMAAYAYARYMGMSPRDIARVRKACSV